MHGELGNVSMKTHSHEHTHTEKGTWPSHFLTMHRKKKKKDASHATDLETNTNLEGHTPRPQLSAIGTLPLFEGNYDVFVDACKHFWTTKVPRKCFLIGPSFSADRLHINHLWQPGR
uniref:Uncharacterized protein n=1 Tax=Rhipicephalus zambeziensis TaxID=60191 RepID=A0A224YHR7_9ACAR